VIPGFSTCVIIVCTVDYGDIVRSAEEFPEDHGGPVGFCSSTPCYLQDVRGYCAVKAGLLTIPMAVTLAVFAQLSGRIVGSRGPRLPLVLAGSPIAAGALLLARLTRHTSVAYLVVAYVIFGIGSGLVTAPITSTAVSGMPIEQAGVAGAVASTRRQIGASLGVAVIGSIVAAGIGTGFTTASHAAWAVIAGCGVAVLLLALLSTGKWPVEPPNVTANGWPTDSRRFPVTKASPPSTEIAAGVWSAAARVPSYVPGIRLERDQRHIGSVATAYGGRGSSAKSPGRASPVS